MHVVGQIMTLIDAYHVSHCGTCYQGLLNCAELYSLRGIELVSYCHNLTNTFQDGLFKLSILIDDSVFSVSISHDGS